MIEEQAPGRELVGFTFSGELPVLVAARMSLSFPVLISTVPLWQIHYRQGRPPRLRRMVFSDGGISSNFPVQLFDSPLPARPTFAIDLAGFEDDEHPNLDDPAECVRLPAKTAGLAVESWKQPESMLDFFLAIKDAVQNWRDNAQARMPGFRERVIHIKLASGEGGLNLAMERPEGRAAHGARPARRARARDALLRHRGHAAPDRALERPPLRALPHPHGLDGAVPRRSPPRLCEGPDAASIPYPERIAAGAQRPPYRLTDEQLRAAQATLAKHLELTDDLAPSLDRGAPRPKSILRNMPPL